MEWFWQTLDMAPTKEISKVKQAYVLQVRELKNKEIREKVAASDYQRLAAAEAAAIASIEGNHYQQVQKEPVAEPPLKAVTPELPQVPTQGAVPKSEDRSRLFLKDAQSLAADCHQKVLLSSWKKLVGRYPELEKAPSSSSELAHGLLVLLTEQLIYLPKSVHYYLSTVCHLNEREETEARSWAEKLAELPDFSFSAAVDLAPKDCTQYFKKRYQLYNALNHRDWQARSFEIAGLLAFFAERHPSVSDQDLNNLVAIYYIKAELEDIVQSGHISAKLDSVLLPRNLPLATVDNPSAVFLRLVFNGIAQEPLTSQQAAFIEKPNVSYLEPALAEFLVGLAFYRSGESDRADKHFKRATEENRELINPLLAQADLQEQGEVQRGALPRNQRRKTPQPKLDLRTIWRFIIILAIGLTIFAANFDNQDKPYNDEDYNDTADESEYWGSVSDQFYELFLSDAVADEQQQTYQREFMTDYVSPDCLPLFESYLNRLKVDAASSATDEISNYEIYEDVSPAGEEIVLYFDGDEPKVILFLDDNQQIKRVVGEQWEEVSSDEFASLLTEFTGYND